MTEVHCGMIIAGKYRLEGALARGGMGSVWQARHLTLDTPLAVKFIGPDVIRLNEARKRFEREAKTAALLKSPHVVQIHDYGVEGDLPYLVMELLAGEDLGERLKRKGRLSMRETSNIVGQVARALRRAAEEGIVHRDLKPSNVFIIRGDEDEEVVKVLDFGIAKTPNLGTGDQTKTGAIIGSPRYMSPEQARGSRLVDPRSDLWSLGVIAYRALTGQLPFQSTDMADLIVKICTERATPPSRIEPDLDPDMDAFFVRALARDPSERFQTAREMAAAFAIAAGEPPPSTTSSFRLLTRPPPGDAQGREALGTLAQAALATASPLVAATPSPYVQIPVECDPTRVSERPPSGLPPLPRRAGSSSFTAPEPAVSRRGASPGPLPAPPLDPAPVAEPVPEAEISLTAYPGMLRVRTLAPPRQLLLRRLAVGAAIAGLFPLALFVIVSRGRSGAVAGGAGYPASALALPSATPPAQSAEEPPAPPPPPPAAASSAPEAPPPATSRPRRTAPAKGAFTKKRHPILGI